MPGSAEAQVVFYILQQDISRSIAACNVAARYGHDKQQLWLHTDSRSAAEGINKLLWTFSDTEFVPHIMAGVRCDLEVPVRICWPGSPASDGATVLNLAGNIPAVTAAQRVVELVVPDNSEKDGARERFRLYREQGLRPQHLNAADLDAVR